MIRRDFLKIAGATSIGSLALLTWADEQVALANPNQLVYQGSDLTGWETALGDGLYAAPGQPWVTPADIATIHLGSHSELRANTQYRGVMAHNITYQRQASGDAFTYAHLCEFEFRLPYIPTVGNWVNNAQTFETSFFVWDGSGSRIDYGMAWQWILNPWMSNFGEVRAWMSSATATVPENGAWHSVGQLGIDTNWHRAKLIVDYGAQATALLIDDTHYLCTFSATSRPSTWSIETAARFGVEIISVYPGNNSSAPLHQAEIRNWQWRWIPGMNRE
jgi:hypothetical protein